MKNIKMGIDLIMKSQIEESFLKLEAYCKSEEFKGYDPYDGLMSRFFRSLPFINRSRFIRLVWIQGFKKSPLNFRPLLGIRKEYNPKALGLFLSAYVTLYRLWHKQEHYERILFFSGEILSLSAPGYNGLCWGYNFDWESRAFFLPKYTPTVVASSFIACALLDAYEITADKKLLQAARSTCDFILKDLNRTWDNNGNFIFSYSKFDNSSVFNASLLASRLLARVYSLTGEALLKEEAGKSVEYVCRSQKEDGSWPYGKLPFHQWIDNFHTGYNLECISDYMKYTGDLTYNENLAKGYKYYKETFFTADGASKYYSTSLYPIDIHAPAQLVITVCKLGKFEEDRELLDRVVKWTMTRMQSSKGFYYFQIWKHYKIRIPYMRWSQAWMLYALSIYLNALNDYETVHNEGSRLLSKTIDGI